MGKKDSEKSWDSVELLEIKADRYVDEVQDELDIYNISVQISSEQMEKLLNDVIAVELEEVKEEAEATRGSIHIRRDGSGKYYSVKNIKLSLTDFLDMGWDLVTGETRFKLFTCTVFLLKLMKRLGADLEEEQAAVCVALYRVGKHYAITDDNLIGFIDSELQDNDYMELGERKIRRIVSGLVEMGIVSLENGRYEVTQQLVFE